MRTLLATLLFAFCLSSVALSQEKTANDWIVEGIYQEEVVGDLTKAREIFEKVLSDCGENRLVCAQALYHVGLVTEKQGGKASGYYNRLLEKYPDAGDYADLARNRLEKINNKNTFIDPRDGHKYKWVKIGDQIWMAENLAYMPWVNPPKKQEYGIWVYDLDGNDVAEAKATENYQKYGCLYDWPTAMALDPKYLEEEWNGDPQNHQGLCPPGWRMPSENDFLQLEKNAGYPLENLYNEDIPYYYRNESKADSVGYYLKATSDWISNGDGNDKYNFNLMPAGYRFMDPTKGYFTDDIGKSTQLWTSTQIKDSAGFPPYAYTRLYRHIWDDKTNNTYSSKSAWSIRNGNSVRCIQSKKNQSIESNKQFASSNMHPTKTLIQTLDFQIINSNIKLIEKSEHQFQMTLNGSNLISTGSGFNASTKLHSFNLNTGDTVWISDFDTIGITDHAEISNNILVGKSRNGLYGMDAETGELIWSRSLKSYYTPDIEEAGSRILSSNGQSVSCLNIFDGKENWKYDLSPDLKGFHINRISILDQYAIISLFGPSRNNLKLDKKRSIIFALDIENGEIAWEYDDYGFAQLGKTAIVDGKIVFFNPFLQYLFAINSANGELEWKLYINDQLQGDILAFKNVILSRSNRYGAEDQSNLYAISSEGQLLKKIKISDNGESEGDINQIGNFVWVGSSKLTDNKDEIMASDIKAHEWKSPSSTMYYHHGHISVIDLESLEKVYEIQLPIAPQRFTKEVDGKIYIGSFDGLYELEVPNVLR